LYWFLKATISFIKALSVKSNKAIILLLITCYQKQQVSAQSVTTPAKIFQGTKVKLNCIFFSMRKEKKFSQNSIRMQAAKAENFAGRARQRAGPADKMLFKSKGCKRLNATYSLYFGGQ